MSDRPASFARACRENLRAVIAAYRQATGLSLTVVSRRHYGNAGFLEAFLRGRQSISIDKYDSLLDSVRAAWPEGAPWPPTRAIVLPRPGKLSTGK